MCMIKLSPSSICLYKLGTNTIIMTPRTRTRPRSREREMKVTKKPKIIFVPYPAQGHVTPMLRLASAFLSRGFSPVVLTPASIHRRISSSAADDDNLDRGITFLALSEDVGTDAPPCDFFSIERSMENAMPSQLERLLLLLLPGGEGHVACVVVDLLASWAIRVAERCGVPVAGFWPAMMATYRLIEAIPELVRTGIVSKSGRPRQPENQFYLPEQPILTAGELPWLIGAPAAQKGRFKFWGRTLERAKTLRWIFVNSFKNEYDHLIHYKTSYVCPEKDSDINGPRIFHVGPLMNNIYQDTSLIAKNPSFWEEDRTCLDWLKQQKPSSVIYVSFGSWVAPIGESKIRTLAAALESSGRPFIWAMNPAWQESLPRGFIHRVTAVKNQGRVVEWAPQMEVLRDEAVGCYLTHCGWNSTVEAMECSRRMLCYPVAGDQFVNCGYIVDVWRVGVRIGGLGQKEVEEGIERVMEDAKMGERLRMLRERVVVGGSELSLGRSLSVFVDELGRERGSYIV